MVDADGRALLVELFRDLAHGDGLGVVHVTHRAAEAAAADRVDHARGGTRRRRRRAPAFRRRGREHRRCREPIRIGAPLITLDRVGHVYSRRTPWANRALTDVDLTIRAGEAIVVVGHNGSGKSTLAWILAGLFAPSEGTALLDGEPIVGQVGRVGLSFQHARLQLLRPTVLDEVRAAGGVDDGAARAALTVGRARPDRVRQSRASTS